ncbi:hypothetical protein FRB94_001393 [Tulasnella sp. JGI-2019a]|nr:hypothetical protein FRB93_013522 [Tulasnella sp. JGI-2019a]KAG9005609.1 hypothetical protein FRB94_001393 [Tulasnella sp. JGI-2019a]KAG9034477.1 hypothetical protein FRB95_013153 [Tulasnella sp. JGI-2019a]
MDRRRTTSTKTRPASAEEVRIWTQTFSSLQEVSRLQAAAPTETLQKVNKWMAALPQDEPTQMESLEHFKTVRAKLTNGLTELKLTAEAEAKALSDALETLSVLIALRRGPTEDKRTKRIRVASPATSAPGSPRINGLASSASLPAPSQLNLSSLQQQSLHNLAHSNSFQSLPLSAHSASSGGRSSLGPQQSMRSRIQQQLPLQPGRKVAFRQPPQGTRGSGGRSGNDFGGGGDGDGETWILAVVKRCIGNDKTRYEVQDEDTEDGEPGQKYTTTLKSLIPLPDPEASPTSPSHPNAYDEYQSGTTVLGLYPDTSCFYTAVVAGGPREHAQGGQRGGAVGKNTAGMYRLKFEDDDDQIRLVGVQWVVSPPL